MNVAASATIEINKGDILGALFTMIPAYAGIHVIGIIVVGSLIGEMIRPKECVIPLVMLSILSLIGWGTWELGHWFAAA